MSPFKLAKEGKPTPWKVPEETVPLTRLEATIARLDAKAAGQPKALPPVTCPYCDNDVFHCLLPLDIDKEWKSLTEDERSLDFPRLYEFKDSSDRGCYYLSALKCTNCGRALVSDDSPFYQQLPDWQPPKHHAKKKARKKAKP
jgi:hypothetical protein